MALKITFETGEIDEFLRLDPGSESRVVEMLRKSSVGEAENFLNHDFSLIVTDTATNTTVITEVEAPPEVKEWVLNRIVEKFENRGQVPKPDFSTLKPFRKLPFSAADTRTVIVEGVENEY